jgi:hypothetical protein
MTLPWVVADKIFKFLDPKSDEKVYFAIVFENYRYLARADVMTATSSTVAHFIRQVCPFEIFLKIGIARMIKCRTILGSCIRRIIQYSVQIY